MTDKNGVLVSPIACKGRNKNEQNKKNVKKIGKHPFFLLVERIKSKK